MAYKRRCRYSGFGYVGKTGKLMCVCDRSGEHVRQSYCHNQCEDYRPMPKSNGEGGGCNA